MMECTTQAQSGDDDMGGDNVAVSMEESKMDDFFQEVMMVLMVMVMVLMMDTVYVGEQDDDFFQEVMMLVMAMVMMVVMAMRRIVMVMIMMF